MDNRKEGIKIVKECIMFVLKKKVLEPELTKIDLKSVVQVFSENFSDSE